MNEKYFKGSEWIKCDLHIHTPFSIENHFGDGNSDEVWEKFISDLENLPEEFKIIGINDYLFIDGYIKVLEYRANGRLSNIDLILPVIELRIDKFGTISADNPFKRVNFHIIFSNELTPEVIKAQFLDAINSEYKLTPDYASNESDWGGVITKENLIHLGKKLIESSNGLLTGSPLKIGFQSLNIPYDELTKKLKNPRLKDKFLTAVGKTEWDALRWESSPAEKKSVINRVDFVFTASESFEAFNKAKEKLTNQNVNDLLLDCSDAHSFSDVTTEKDRIGNCFTWVKINPTFEGLKYLTYEPEDRIFVGAKPEVKTRVNANKTRYISKLTISQEAGYNETQGVWFKNQEIYPSKELTAIIGNKGKGKSAITDVIGLLGNSHNEKYFSFLDLDKKKFRKGSLAHNFNATLYWESNISVSKNLSEHTDNSMEEKVKYLPQSYFEELCNEIDNNENFVKELNHVVFQHIDTTDRLGKNTFDEFVEEKKKNPEITIKTLRENLGEVNSEIVSLQEKHTEDYKKGIESKIKNLKEDLKSHTDSKPKNPFPDDKKGDDQNPEEPSENYKKLKVIEKSLGASHDTENKYNDELENVNAELVQLNQIRHRFESEKERVDLFRDSEESILKEFDISIDDVYDKPKINFVPIDKVIKKKKKKKLIYQLHLGKVLYSDTDHKDMLKKDEELLITQIAKQKEEYQKLSKSLNTTQKAKEDYNNELIEWNKVKKEIEGEQENSKVGTLNYFNKELKYIDENLPTDIVTQKGKRKVVSGKIYDEKRKIVDIYSHLKTNIDKVLADNSDKIDEYKISLDASFQIRNLESNFLEFIDKARVGSFYGQEDAVKKFKSLLENIVPNDKDSVIALLESLTDSLEQKDEVKQNPFNQIKSAKRLQDLYDYIYGLDYLNEKYELKFANKSIEQLSPGERGAALIVFYLLLDNDDKPLIIDQPEDNLDNQSVYEILVPFIKQAKKHRQLIIVTHNPNLAVVADAEQIIHVDIDKENNYTFSSNSGGIESPSINKGIVDILEGTMPAFDKRKLKYLK
ncbi:DNA repair protein [bacterium AH-315-P13]|nr:DNA repair protein [bacterium AH-315-P13]